MVPWPLGGGQIGLKLYFNRKAKQDGRKAAGGGKEVYIQFMQKSKYTGFFTGTNVTGNSKNETGRINLARNKTARGLSSPEGGLRPQTRQE